MHVRNAAWCRTTPIVLVCLLKHKGNATVVSTSDWIEKALLIEDVAHMTLATDKMQSSLLIKQFFSLLHADGQQLWPQGLVLSRLYSLLLNM